MSIAEGRVVENDLLRELSVCLARVDPAEVDMFVERLQAAPRVFVHGAGRSGLVLRMFAMRLSHLGRAVHVVGETTTPRIDWQDLLVVASASGQTRTVVDIATEASELGTPVISITTRASSTLGRLASARVVVPAPSKAGEDAASAQFAGSLFEQGINSIAEFALVLGSARVPFLMERGIDESTLAEVKKAIVSRATNRRDSASMKVGAA